MYRTLVFFLLLWFQLSWSQQTKVFRINEFEVSKLQDSLKETSGLDFFQNKLYTFNDSGNTSELFEIDKKNGKILKILKTNLVNKDWEALTSDSVSFYVGDIGNNVGNRKDLTIYKIPFSFFQQKSSFQNEKSPNQDNEISKITFYYPEQKDFQPKNLNNDFDAEAMIFLHGKIHLFTKEWVSKNVSHYEIDPNISIVQPAKKTEVYPAGFSVTDAAYYDKKLYLVGYTKWSVVYMMIFEESEPGIFFKNKPIKLELGSAFNIGQIEGIAVDDSGIYLSSEAFHSPFGTFKQRFYHIPSEKIQ